MEQQLRNFNQRHQLKPLCELDVQNRERIFESASLQELEPRTLITPEINQTIYLLDGQVNLLSGGFVSERFSHQQPRALSPIFDQQQEQDSALFNGPGIVVCFDKLLLDKLYQQHLRIMEEDIAEDLIASDQKIFHLLLAALQQDNMPIPDLPETAFDIRQNITGDSGIGEIIELVQPDPSLCARLIKAVNSPLYGTWREINTIRDAIRRLGSETSRELSLSLSLIALFDATNPLVKNQMDILYQESCAIAALAYVISSEYAEQFNPEKALLAGLIQNIGQLPVLKYFDENPGFILSEENLRQSLNHLQLPICRLLFKHWLLDDEFLQIVKHAEDWGYQSVHNEDYCDVIIAARLLYKLENQQLLSSDLQQYPAIRKLKILEQVDAEKILEKFRYKFEQMQILLAEE